MKIFILVLSLCLVVVWSRDLGLPGNLRLNRARRQDEEPAEDPAPAPAPARPPPRPQASGSAPTGRQTLATTGTAYALPDGAELLVSGIKTTFNCDGRIYGYYADPDNNCQIFHVCVPIQDQENGIDQTIQYSFVCGNQTVFDQESLVCTYPEDAVPCKDAAGLYDQVNRNFGVTDRPPRQRAAGDEPESTIPDSKEATITKTKSTNGNGNGNGKTTTLLKETTLSQ